MRKFIFIGLTFWLIPLITATTYCLHATTFTVTTTNISGPGSLPVAIAEANATPGNNQIQFSVTNTITLGLPLPTITNNVAITGRTDVPTVISGGGTLPLFTFVAGTTNSLSNLVLTNGYTTNSGAAINNAGTLSVSGCAVMNNLAPGGYGGAVNNAGTMTIANTAFQNNWATNGGAVFSAGTMTVADCLLSQNQAGNGGAIYNTGILALDSLAISSNMAKLGFGGAVYNAGTLTVNSSTLAFNQASGGSGGVGGGGGGGLGGALFVSSGTVGITNSTFFHNAALGGGGGGINYYSSGAAGNGGGNAGGIAGYPGAAGGFGGGGGGGGGGGTGSAGGNGGNGGFGGGGGGGGGGGIGGVNTYGEGLPGGYGGTGGSSAFAGGYGSDGSTGATGNWGAVQVIAAPEVEVRDLAVPRSYTLDIARWSIVRVARNSATGGSGGSSFNPGQGIAGGIYNYSGTVSLLNTIVAGNNASNNCPDLSGSFLSSGYNLIGNNQGATNLSIFDFQDVAANLGPLQNNGGPDLTCAPLPGSLAIGNAASIGAPATDQRGVPRPQGGAFDIGAVQVVTGSPVFIGWAMNADSGFCLSTIFDATNSYRVQASTNLTNWTALTNYGSGGAQTFIDTGARNLSRRFYRTATP